jgi:hypothetical protein
LIYRNDLFTASSLFKCNSELKDNSDANKMGVNVSKTKLIIYLSCGRTLDLNLKLAFDDNEPNEQNPD